MRYHFLEGATKTKKRSKKLLILLPLFGLISGGYILLNMLAPSLPIDSRPSDATVQKLVAVKPGLEGDRVYIPQINVDVAISEGDTADALEKGAWHRTNAGGNPEKGGNFVLSAHRFLLGMTPQQTRAKSPFYNLDKLQPGDDLFVDWAGQRYAYKVEKKFSVNRMATEIEAPSSESKLILYSCELRGEAAGREVIQAKPIGTVAWSNDKSYIKQNR
jgi:sortase A